MYRSLLRKKSAEAATTSTLVRCLNAFDLTLLGIGAIIGAGIFVLTGIAAALYAGPAVILSFVLSGFACALSALSYAELATSIGGCGSAYGYAYAALGEIFAWIIGWVLLLEYGVACSAVAIGWSAYVNNALASIGLSLPTQLAIGPFQGGIINLPAMIVIALITFFLSLGVSESARLNRWIVFIKLSIIAIFIFVATFHVNPVNWHPFLPFGWAGVIHGAAIVFFAYIGFDAVTTAAEEAINPQRDLPIGIIASLIICVLVYVVVSGLLTGTTHYSDLNVASPVSYALLRIGYRELAGLIALGAIAGLTTVILVMFYGFTRVFLAMTRDGLLPKNMSVVHPKTHTPLKIILLAGAIMMLIAGFVPMRRVAELVNIGTLMAFMIVCIGVIILRKTAPNLPRSFKVPFSPYLPGLGALLCFYLMLHLPKITWISFLIWMILGLIIYFSYSYRNSLLRNSKSLS